MNIHMKSLITVLIAFFVSIAANAQVFEITAYGSQSLVFGDFAETDLSKKGAGYASNGMSAGLALNYYFKNNFGIGLRGSATFYEIDEDAFQADIISQLGITGTNYDFSNPLQYGFGSFNTEVGVSYLFDVGEKWQLEPYAYIGAVALASPTTSVVYQENGVTYTQEIKQSAYTGFSYAPGLRLKWNVGDRIGLNAFFEYQGSIFSEGDETSINQSFNSLEIETRKREYSINAVALGFGLSYRCGKGLTE